VYNEIRKNGRDELKMLTVILTGGASRRMGKDKALLPYRGKTLLRHLIDVYAPYGEVAVSVREKGLFPCENAAELPDLYPDCGPLNGILSGFLAFDVPELFLTAVDLPFGSPALALRLSGLRGDADACILRRGKKGMEPGFAIYGRGCMDAARDCLAGEDHSFFRMLEHRNVRYVAPEELPEFDLSEILTNVNTPEDYARLPEN